jgi:hypothetical protein
MTARFSTSEFDVVVRDFQLRDGPASLRIGIEVGKELKFSSTITYDSISTWRQVRERCGSEQRFDQLLGALMAWDGMRFMALGGSRLRLPEGLGCSPRIKEIWRTCFLKQYGEWRCRNDLHYGAGAPCLECQDVTTPDSRDCACADGANRSRTSSEKWLLTNGGGKDTLAGLLLLEPCDIQFDLYEGYMPIGGTIERQTELLARLRNALGLGGEQLKIVTIEDDFYDRPEADFKAAGVQTDLYKLDFAIGHTANYVGFFPLILAHGYSRIFLNIERSADDTMVVWNGEDINHQWCKSIEYQRLSEEVFRELVPESRFRGFESTLRGQFDTSIYSIIAKDRDLLKQTHSCNYGKPWCCSCPKCCFCYLMMSSRFGEAFAKDVVGTRDSLFDRAENEKHWRDLLEPKRVAWECVPSYQECLLAANDCLSTGVRSAILEEYICAPEVLAEWRELYSKVHWEDVPEELRTSLSRRLSA